MADEKLVATLRLLFADRDDRQISEAIHEAVGPSRASWIECGSRYARHCYEIYTVDPEWLLEGLDDLCDWTADFKKRPYHYEFRGTQKQLEDATAEIGHGDYDT